ncbi:hypothetical protein [Vibrio cyclitrophicus]|uniref:hypothetical protein n=1 Tax=Vibrio cyclitrophicus TaxID=47951 RepID=UPI001C07E3AD|nr:hypothetical protein [Vibrio cyclitrophicus]MBU2932215.1 hypothetical protein [Vibrio cyclitrophicus]
MKDVFKSLKDNATSRLKNPVVGAFVLSWCALNINGLTIFMLSGTSDKIHIVSNKVWSLNEDILLPLFIATLYLVLLPLLNLVYELINDGVINSFRHRRQNAADKERFLQQKSTVGAKIEADEEFIRKLKDKEVENWLQEKALRSKQMIEQKAKYAELFKSSSEKEQMFYQSRSELNNIIENLKSELEITEQQFNHSEQDAAAKVIYLDDILTNMSKIIDSLAESDNYSSSELKELGASIWNIRSKFAIWDDIPF